MLKSSLRPYILPNRVTQIMPSKESKNKVESARASTTPKVPGKSKEERKIFPKTFIPQSIVMVVIAFLVGVLTPPLRHVLRQQPEDENIRFVKYSFHGLATI